MTDDRLKQIIAEMRDQSYCPPRRYAMTVMEWADTVEKASAALADQALRLRQAFDMEQAALRRLAEVEQERDWLAERLRESEE